MAEGVVGCQIQFWSATFEGGNPLADVVVRPCLLPFEVRGVPKSFTGVDAVQGSPLLALGDILLGNI